jgi:hypothetical protein
MMKHSLDPQLLEQPIRILVVGCGGNGSAIVSGLPYLHQAMLAFGHPGGLQVTLIDPDTISETTAYVSLSAGQRSGSQKPSYWHTGSISFGA